MDYRETINYLFSRLPMFSRIGADAYKKDLGNTIALCNFLGNPQDHFKCIHIAGTNGKGSVSHMLAAIFQKAGYKTGLYTSPHLKDFRERIRVNGEMISEAFVIDFTESIREKSEEIGPSFFELTVAMAFAYFKDQRVDIAIIETGLGGRLDSTNIIRPELSIITNIGMDHMNLLGDTLEKIAYEKAGIIKESVPVVIGQLVPETEPVFRKAADEKKAPLYPASENSRVISWSWENDRLNVKIDDENYSLDLPGQYQVQNLLTVLEAIKQLRIRGWKMDPKTLHEALGQVKKLTGLHGRWEIIRKSPLVIVDVAHNEDGIRQLVQQVRETAHRKTHIIFGTVKDKDPDPVLKLLPKDAIYYFTRAQIPRALPEDELLRLAAAFGLQGRCYSSVNTSLYAASLAADPQDMILICGSIFVAGELSMESVKAIWGKEENATAVFEAAELAAWVFFR